MKKKLITIVGLGLMGGSLGLALNQQRKKIQIFGVSRNKSKLNQALKSKVISKGSTSLSQIPQETELICICVPVPKILPTLLKLEKTLTKKTIVTDVGSTKLDIMKQVKQAKLKKVCFVGSHPMAGSHNTGLSAADKNLYKGSNVFVISDGATSEQRKIVSSFWKQSGAKTITVVTAKAHDQIAAEISHMPHMVSSLLMQSVQSRSLKSGGSGFKDVTRLAQGDPDLWMGIISSSPFLSGSLKQFKKELQKFISLLDQKKWNQIKKILSNAETKRRQLK